MIAAFWVVWLIVVVVPLVAMLVDPAATLPLTGSTPAWAAAETSDSVPNPQRSEPRPQPGNRLGNFGARPNAVTLNPTLLAVAETASYVGADGIYRPSWGSRGKVMMVESPSEASARLCRLSLKEREVLDHILEHKSLKVIAHDLNITLSAVDQRLKSARQKLGATDRNDAARRYRSLTDTCRKSTCGFEGIAHDEVLPITQTSEPLPGSTFTLQDSATFTVAPPWLERGHRGAISEVLDEKFGRSWRVVAIPVFAVIISVLSLALMAMAKTLGELL